MTDPKAPAPDANACHLDPRQRRRGLIALSAAVAGAGFVMAMQMGLNANFLADVIGVSGLQLGILEAVRETCGITALLGLALFAGLAEPVIGALMLVLFGLGLGGYTFVSTYGAVVAMSVVWSQGLHIWMPLPRSMAMALAEPHQAGRRLGQMHAAGSAGFVVGLLAAYLLTRIGVPLRPLFLVAAGVGLIAATFCLGIPRQIKTPGPRFVLRKRYGLYYLLSFLEGWRKQIFVCFAGFLLVRVHGTPLETILMLWGLVQLISYLAAPRVGTLIDRIGERRILVFYFSCLTAFFIGYATIPNRFVLYGLFVVDSAFFVLAMGLTTYVNRLAPPAERTPTLGMGVAMNHAAAVTMPLLGGWAWYRFGYQWPFLIGAAAAALSILAALRLPPHRAPEPT